MKKDYFALWSLLAVAFAIFFALSTCSNISIGGITLKPSKLSASLFDSEEAAIPVAPTDSIAETPVMEIQAAPDTLPKTILFVGDSMLEGLSPRLAAYCQSSGHTLYTVIWYSSTSDTWGKCTRLQKYINDLQPDYVFICLGSNELFVSNIAEKRDVRVKAIVQQIGSLPYLWIGPPNWREDTGINDLIAANVRPGCYFRSKGMHFDRKSDGAHPTSASASLWMDSIMRWMPANSAYPLWFNEPERATGRPARIFVHAPDDMP